jgi:hypothetical protein
MSGNVNVHQLSAPETEWLSLIRYQLLMAIEQSRAPSPLNGLAINTLQDCVEAMLSLVAQSIGANLKSRTDFDKPSSTALFRMHWEAIPTCNNSDPQCLR